MVLLRLVRIRLRAPAALRNFLDSPIPDQPRRIIFLTLCSARLLLVGKHAVILLFGMLGTIFSNPRDNPFLLGIPSKHWRTHFRSWASPDRRLNQSAPWRFHAFLLRADGGPQVLSIVASAAVYVLQPPV
jgi:hypothetical protein